MSYRDVRWQDDAACLGMDTNLFFEKDPLLTTLDVCRGCPVSSQCEGAAVRNDERFGIWGGKRADDIRKRVR